MYIYIEVNPTAAVAVRHPPGVPWGGLQLYNFKALSSTDVFMVSL